MQVDIELYVTPSGCAEDLGRFMDDFVSVAESGSVQHDKVWSSLISLMDLREKDPEEVRDHLVTCAIWRWFDDLPVYRTSGEPCVFFSVVQYEDEGSAELRIHAFGAALRLSNPDEAEWEAKILARCRSLGLCN
jgi:hypothetical protein